MPKIPVLEYASPKASRKHRRIVRRVLLGGSGLLCLLGCPLFGYCLRFSATINYIDGGAGKPITPEDQRTLSIAAMLPYLGIALFIVAIVLLIYVEYRDRPKLRRLKPKSRRWLP